MASGIYAIVAPSENKYVGSAVDLLSRKRGHFCELRLGKHGNPGLTRAARKYGLENLEFRILLICRREDLIMYEQRAIDILKPKYNRRPTAESMLGFRHSPASNLKNSKSKRGSRWITNGKERTVIRSDVSVPDGWMLGRLLPDQKKVRVLEPRKSRIGIKQPREAIEKRQVTRKANAEARGYWVKPHPNSLAALAKSRGRKLSPEEIVKRQATRRANAEANGSWFSAKWKSKQRKRSDLKVLHTKTKRYQNYVEKQNGA